MDQVQDFIDKYNKAPRRTSKDPLQHDEKKLGTFISACNQNYKKNTWIMKDPNIRKIYEDFV